MATADPFNTMRSVSPPFNPSMCPCPCTESRQCATDKIKPFGGWGCGCVSVRERGGKQAGGGMTMTRAAGGRGYVIDNKADEAH